MTSMQLRMVLLGGAFTLVSGAALADPQIAATVRDKALTDPTAWNIMESLTTEIGPRPAGSPAAMRARDWGLALLKKLGFKNVHAEEFPKPSWERGEEDASVVAPYPQKLAIIGLGDSAPTPPQGIDADVVVFNSYADMLAQPVGAFTGKIVLVDQPMVRTQNGAGYGAAVPARISGASEAARRGAIAYLVRSIATGSGRAPHTGDMTYKEGIPKIPAGALGVPDADLVMHMAERGPVHLHVKLLSTVHPDTKAWNVSGEIPGGGAPDEVIVIGGHLDSWDPGTGAIDDGAGVAITTAAAHLIGEGKHPRRTIRVVMWGSEETEGASAAYIAAHLAEVPHIALAAESDFGCDGAYAVQLPAGAIDQVEIKPLAGLLAPLRVLISRDPATHGGTDTEGLRNQGVPQFSVNEDGSHYFDYHHSADDTMAVVDPAQLNQVVATWAATLEILADSDVDFRPAAKP
jgi:hypothetical protein